MYKTDKHKKKQKKHKAIIVTRRDTEVYFYVP